MQLYYTFLDEYGDTNLKNIDKVPYYSVTAILTNEKGKEDLETNLSKLKEKYFGSKSYIIHRTKLLSLLKRNKKDIGKFIKDLSGSLKNHFFVFQVVVDKEKAKKKGWDRNYIYKQAFRVLLGNLVKFSVARDVRNIISSEASSVSQDIHIYENFFHFIANGIPRLGISTSMVKKHQTSLNFVTKVNNDAGEQLADLLSKSAVIKHETEKNSKSLEELNDLDRALFEITEKKLSFIKLSPNVKNPLKKRIYPSINTYKMLP